ncbi:MAG: class I SAM-dependent methyltransferase [Bdellovibrionaceae bacterium]|nr:class I SAM-dependent methyltransferase [Pseudobdellovibrionaceae bacterium]
MKIHDHLVEKIIKAWAEIFEGQVYADKAIEKRLKTQRKWGSRDRKFFAESVYEGVRWWRRLWALLDEEPSTQLDDLARLWAVMAFEQGWLEDPENWDIDPDHIRKRQIWLEREAPRAVRESIPDWLDELGERELGAAWDSVLSSLNEKSVVDLRTNTLKGTREELQMRLREDDIETVPIEGVPTGLTLKVRKNVFATKAFQEGLFEVQDRASQLVAPLVNPQPGERVIDACAGAGGKTLHLGALMKNKGKVLSLDIHEWKLEELRKRARRDGVNIVETRVIESTKVIKRLAEGADRVLLDVPCSGLGVLRRNPDTKWKITPEELTSLRQTQAEILKSYSRMVKPGGTLVYATCSCLPSENQEQVESFLKDHGADWALIEQEIVRPDQGRGDGFFAARLERKRSTTI